MEEIPTEAIFLVGLKVLVVIKALYLHGSVQVPAKYAASYHMQSRISYIAFQANNTDYITTGSLVAMEYRQAHGPLFIPFH